ncbi:MULTISPECIES: DUF4233 domain-containing protein [unclassified Clavibacter]|uniref:DUF4233 domain-containing protein n=1 Tax=unclassified Clavibacter TaxID=2626594 RepID=UPI0022EA978E|nr:DUF4233 domain-containing protein [Clavibacter sp. CT19]MDA3805783.1 DUF4233 domain-containing protein [Clavibacter sp. CT19]
MSTDGRPARTRRPRPPRTTVEILGSIVMGFQVIVVFLASLVAFGLEALPALPALGGGALLVLAMLAVVGSLRTPLGVRAGWVVQILVVLTGFVLPAMFAVGGFFLLLWVYAMVQGARIDREKAAARGAWEQAMLDEQRAARSADVPDADDRPTDHRPTTEPPAPTP